MIINSININYINNLLRVLCGYFFHYLRFMKDRLMNNIRNSSDWFENFLEYISVRSCLILIVINIFSILQG